MAIQSKLKNKPDLKSVPMRSEPRLASMRKFLAFCEEKFEQPDGNAYQIIRYDDDQPIPVDPEDVDGNPGQYELRKGNEIIIRTVSLAPRQPTSGIGRFRDAGSISAEGASRTNSNILEPMLHHNAFVNNALKESDLRANRYREDADRYRDENLQLRGEILDLKQKLADTDSGDESMTNLASMAIQAWQSSDFRKNLVERARVAMQPYTEDEQAFIRKFLDRPEFSGSWGIQLPDVADVKKIGS